MKKYTRYDFMTVRWIEHNRTCCICLIKPSTRTMMGMTIMRNITAPMCEQCAKQFMDGNITV